jgi:cytochrome c peroxidase
MMKVFIYLSVLFCVLSCNKKDDSNTPAGTTVYTLEYPAYFGKSYIVPNDNVTTNEGVQLGRFLFYDSILSKDNSISCASCHQQEFAFSDPAILSNGVEGKQTRRHSMTIVNALWQKGFFWDGRSSSLEHQALEPIKNPDEMNLPIEEALQRLNTSEFYREKFKTAFAIETISANHLANALAQFQRILISGNSKYDQYKRNEYTLTAQEERGMNLFFTHPEPSQNLRGGNCNDCHTGFLTSGNEFHNNGLNTTFYDDQGREEFTNLASDKGKFKTPTLRNIATSTPYMHDGRFSSLEEVLDHYNEHIQPSTTLDPLITLATNNENGTSLGLTAQEKEDIISFLHLLTDIDFLSNPAFSNPF